MQQYYRPICIVSRTAKKMFENTERTVIYYEEKISSFNIVWNDGDISFGWRHDHADICGGDRG